MIRKQICRVLLVLIPLTLWGCSTGTGGPDPRTIPGGSGTALVAECFANPNLPICSRL